MFWGPQTLLNRIQTEGLIDPFDPNKIERANYTLSVGEQAFVTPNDDNWTNKDYDVQLLDGKNGVVIPPGQFAFILTHETVKVPKDAIAFISMRVKYKNRGLVNVSGFHVDPGWKGKLIFAVFNAGPLNIKIHHADPYFHIWYASIDGNVENTKSKWDNQIQSDLINNIGRPMISMQSLQNRLNELEIKQDRNRLMLGGALALLLPIVTGLAIALGTRFFDSKPDPTPVVIQEVVKEGVEEEKIATEVETVSDSETPN